jgi:hypothetical protein
MARHAEAPAMSDDDAVTLEELEAGMRSLGVSRALRRTALRDVRAVARALVAEGCAPDRLRYRATICDCCGALSVTTFGGDRRRVMH